MTTLTNVFRLFLKRKKWTPNESTLTTLAILLSCIGILFIYEASYLKAEHLFSDPFYFSKRQIAVAIAGFLVYFILQKIPLQWIDRLTLPLMGIALALSCVLLIPGVGTHVGGATRWIRLGPIGFQPAEICKLSVVFFVAKNTSRSSLFASRVFDKKNFLTTLKTLLSHLSFPLVICALLIPQPDFGSCFLILVTTYGMLFCTSFPLTWLLSLAGCGVMLCISAILYAPYRMKRLAIFLDPWAQIQEGGFQIIQSLLAFQNGGFFGSGLGQSKQKLFFLPEAHSDFIFAVIAEELGLIGVIGIIGLFMTLIWTGYRISTYQPNLFRSQLALGLTLTLGIQALINLGVTMAILPPKGIPLPFVSSGPSSLLTCIFMAGLLCRLASPVPHASTEREHQNLT